METQTEEVEENAEVDSEAEIKDPKANKPKIEKPKSPKRIETKTTTEKDLIDEAKEAAAELREANTEHARLLDREEKIRARDIIHGRSIAGSEPKPETADEKWKREAKERYKGTGMDPT